MTLPNCADCKHFCPNGENFPQHMGWCDLTLPTWFTRQVPFDVDDFSRSVRRDDSCSFFNDK